MNEPQHEDKKYQLSNLIVNSIGLVRRGANRKPFYFVKSADGTQGEEMSDKTQDVQEELFSADQVEGLLTLLAAKADEPAADKPDETESAKLSDGEDFAEMLAQERTKMQEDFAAKLAVETARTEKLTERLDASEHQRRLRQFTDVAATYSLPVSGVEQFGEDLMAIKDSLGDEVYERLTTMLRASDEAIKSGALFEQFSHAAPGETGDPFEAKIRPIQEKLMTADPHKKTDEAYSEAMKIASELHPQLASAFAEKSLGGA